MISSVENSPLKTKRFRVLLDNGKHYDFGLRSGSTYLDHQDKTKRDNYRKRHLANPLEKARIENYTPSPATFSYHLLWGDSTDLTKNVKALNRHL